MIQEESQGFRYCKKNLKDSDTARRISRNSDDARRYQEFQCCKKNLKDSNAARISRVPMLHEESQGFRYCKKNLSDASRRILNLYERALPLI
jgi:hypothetical protein